MRAMLESGGSVDIAILTKHQRVPRVAKMAGIERMQLQMSGDKPTKA
jgi:hypothetical protein